MGRRAAIAGSAEKPRAGRRLRLRSAIDYPARDAIGAGGRRAAAVGETGGEGFAALMRRVIHSLPAPEVDLLIRTGGEKRLSDFLLWECAYAELHFVDCMWPDFDECAFDDALEEYARRERRFGAIDEDRFARSSHG
jgi:undecaprenyl diphosphate synthase